MSMDDEIINDMKETRDRSIEIIMLMQICFLLEAITSSIVGSIIFLASYFLLHFSNSQLITEVEIFVGIVVGMMGITGLIGIIKQRMMLKEVDNRSYSCGDSQ